MSHIFPADQLSITRAAAIIRSGRLVAFPTETVYGLGANALDPVAVQRIFTAKGRPATNPLIVHVDSVEMLLNLTLDIETEMARGLIDHFWPGPLTLVLIKSAIVPHIVTAGGETVAVRMPRHPVALALIRACGVPLAAPSANRSEQLSPTRAEHVAESLGDSVEMILDGGPTEVGLESTVIDLTCDPPRLLRPGMVSQAQLEAVLGRALQTGANIDMNILKSPGQMARHYSPRTPLILKTNVWECLELETRRIAVLSHITPSIPLPANIVTTILPAAPVTYAAQLYDALHRLDAVGAEVIFVETVPEGDGWAAIRDRLERASR